MLSSVLPATGLDTRNVVQHSLLPMAVASTHLAVLLGFGNHCFEYKFIVANVAYPLLGANFLRHYSLLVDLTNKRLVDADTYATIPLEL